MRLRIGVLLLIFLTDAVVRSFAAVVPSRAVFSGTQDFHAEPIEGKRFVAFQIINSSNRTFYYLYNIGDGWSDEVKHPAYKGITIEVRQEAKLSVKSTAGSMGIGVRGIYVEVD